jgi:hypothetical protein
VTESKAQSIASQEVQDANESHLDAIAVRLREEAAYNVAERREKLLSRELSRRTGRSDRENRNSRWNA